MLYFLIGPSGVGKDTVLETIKKYDFGNDEPIIATHRYITRPPRQNDENHVELTRADFKHRIKSDFFMFHWESHGYRYGIGKEVLQSLDSGNDVIVNGSRKYIHKAQEVYPDLKIIWLTVSEAILRERLIQRGRESRNEIEARIARTLTLSPFEPKSGKTIYNDQSINKTVEEVIRFIKSQREVRESNRHHGAEICG